MDTLDARTIPDEIALIRTIRKDYWRCRERQRRSVSEMLKAEREVMRSDLHAAHIDGKIYRLRGYAKFIDGGWVNENVLDVKGGMTTDVKEDPATRTSKPEPKIEPSVKREPSESSVRRDVNAESSDKIESKIEPQDKIEKKTDQPASDSIEESKSSKSSRQG